MSIEVSGTLDTVVGGAVAYCLLDNIGRICSAWIRGCRSDLESNMEIWKIYQTIVTELHVLFY